MSANHPRRRSSRHTVTWLVAKASVAISEIGGKSLPSTCCERRGDASRMQTAFSASLIGDDFLHEVHDVGGALFRLEFGQHMTFVAAVWFSRHKPEHPVKATPLSSRRLHHQYHHHYRRSFYRTTACNATHIIAMSEMSVRLSVCQTRGLWQKERNLCPHSYTTWKIIHRSFLRRRTFVGGDTFYLKFWAKLTPLEQKHQFSIDIRS